MKLEVPTNWVASLDQFAAHLRAAGFSGTTIERRLTDMAQVARAIGPDGPEMITGDSLVDWVADRDWCTETRRGRRNSFRTFWRWAIAAGVCTEDASAKLPPVRAPRAKPRPAPDRIYRPALALATKRVRIILRLGAELGLRRAEIAVVHVGRDLYRDEDGWWLRVHGKGGKQDTLPVPDDLALEIWAGAPGHSPTCGFPRDGWLLPGEIDGHLSPRHVGDLASQELQAHQDRNELPWTLHKLRHRFGTRALRRTRDIRAVQMALRHASLATTQIYCATDNEAVRAAVIAAA